MSEIRKLSHSSMASWRRCRARFYWGYVKNYTTRSSEGQRRGSISHAALAEWYRSYDETKAIQTASDALFEYEHTDDRDYSDEWELTEIVLRRYFEWSRHNDNFKAIELEIRKDINIGPYPMIAIIDGIVELHGKHWVLEHKFEKRASINHIDLDQQISIYILAGRKLGYDIEGAIYNVIRVAKGGVAEQDPVLRKMVYRNQEGLDVVERELELQAREIHNFIDTQGENAVYRNPTKDCSWDCSFYNACLSINDSGSAMNVLSRLEIRNFDS
jgi:hypothetical protein